MRGGHYETVEIVLTLSKIHGVRNLNILRYRMTAVHIPFQNRLSVFLKSHRDQRMLGMAKLLSLVPTVQRLSLQHSHIRKIPELSSTRNQVQQINSKMISGLESRIDRRTGRGHQAWCQLPSNHDKGQVCGKQHFENIYLEDIITT